MYLTVTNIYNSIVNFVKWLFSVVDQCKKWLLMRCGRDLDPLVLALMVIENHDQLLLGQKNLDRRDPTSSCLEPINEKLNRI